MEERVSVGGQAFIPSLLDPRVRIESHWSIQGAEIRSLVIFFIQRFLLSLANLIFPYCNEAPWKI